MSERTRRIVADHWEARLPEAEFEALLEKAKRELVETNMREEIRELHRWFIRRYPTAPERIAYMRRHRGPRPE